MYPAADEAAGLALSTLIIKLGKSSNVARGRRARPSGVGEAKAVASAARPNLKCAVSNLKLKVTRVDVGAIV
jgi:hypothetical protein